MTRTTLILLQALGAILILPYPAILVANVMSMAAPGRTVATTLFWGALSLYPLVLIALDVMAWKAWSRGAVKLAFGLSGVPAIAVIAAVSFYVVGTVGFFVAPGRSMRSTTFPSNNPVIDPIYWAEKDIDIGRDAAGAVARTLRQVDGNPGLINTAAAGYGTPLHVALGSLDFKTDGSSATDQRYRIELIKGLIARGARLSGEEAADLRTSWLLRRALHEGPIATARENALVWRIVTHDRGPSKPFRPLVDTLPRPGTEPAFVIRGDEAALLNRATQLHGTPLYAALLDKAADVAGVVIRAGGRLSAGEEQDAAVTAALRSFFEQNPELEGVYRGGTR